MKRSELRNIIREEIKNLSERENWVVSPERLIDSAWRNGLLSDDEMMSSKVRKASQYEAENLKSDWPEGQGFGSSDMTASIFNMLQDAGFKPAYDKGMLIRKDVKQSKEVSGKMVKGRYPESPLLKAIFKKEMAAWKNYLAKK